MISENQAKKYCSDDISLIENYDSAISDTKTIWHCHHRRETIYSMKELIEIGEYYDRPPEELIFLPQNEHRSLHSLGNKHGFGKRRSEETRKKISLARTGKRWSSETIQKIRDSHRGKHPSEETRRKLGAAMSVRMIGNKNVVGKLWWNNGVRTVRAKECPGEGWVRGRLKR